MAKRIYQHILVILKRTSLSIEYRIWVYEEESHLWSKKTLFSQVLIISEVIITIIIGKIRSTCKAFVIVAIYFF